ncbi:MULTISPECIES: autotransporter domain-containing protein [unclassified Achromobacter]|uniref:autotransporter outer membrane beta-barrel domain-containing protein n=1 Tax=unclassified Achromobacter TaxID=2626865 RepID=UPI000B516CBE|nr:MULTISPECIES: autotransporter domain-containing protein [unclassified Achromobacter]OWT73778.1 hypothetical protein CEY05_22095 [Achromobacter sp. HZ34]OWT79306.1 hypothetical protein CEY04_09885 [Achromobacter sp. HZ28]
MSKSSRNLRPHPRSLQGLTTRRLLIPASLGFSLLTGVTAQAQSVTVSSSQATHYEINPGTDTLTIASGVTISDNDVALGDGPFVLQDIAIINNGTISGGLSQTSATPFGILLTVSGSVTNNGLINADKGTAVGLTGGDYLQNNGTITGHDVGVYIAGGTLVNGSSADNTALILSSAGTALNSPTALTLTNYGTIASQGGQAATIAGGTITNYGLISATGGDGFTMNGAGTVDNRGTISSTTGTGVLVGANATITNSGTIESLAGLAAVQFSPSGGRLNLETGSVLTGGINAAGGNTQVVLHGSNTMSSTIAGIRTLTMAGTDWTLSGQTLVTNTEVQTGTLHVNGIYTSNTVVDAGATLAGTGTMSTVTAQNGATVMPGSATAPGILTVGTYTQQAGSTLLITTTPTSASELAVTGAATLGGVLSVNSLAGAYAPVTNYIVLTAGTGLTGTFSSVLESDASLVPTLTYDTALNRVILTLASAAVWTVGDNNVTLNGDVSADQDGLTGNDTLNLIGIGKVTANLANIDTLNIGDLAATVTQVSLDAGTQTVGATRILPNGTLILNGGQFSTGTLDLAGGVLTANVDSTIGAPTTLSANSEISAADGRTLTLSGDVSGVGHLLKTGAGMLVLNGANTYSGGTQIGAGTLEVGDADHSGASIQGFTRVDSGGTLRGHGTVVGNVVNEGIVWPGGSIGTLTVNGDFMQSSNGTLMVDISPDSASQLKVTGTAQLGGTLSLLYGPGTYHATTYRLVDAGAVEGAFSKVTGNAPAGYSQAVATSANAVDLKLAARTDVAGDTGDSDDSGGTGSGDVTTTVAPTNASIFGAVGSSALRDGQRTADTLLGRLARPCPTDSAAGCERPTNQAWVRATSDTTHQGGNNNAPGNTDQRYGFLVGADHNMGPWTVGLAGGYSHGDVKEGDATGRIDTLRLAAYGSRQVGAINVAGMVGGAYDFISTRRSFGSLGTTRNTSDGQEAQAGLQASMPLQAGPTVITPRVGLRYQYFHGNSFSEEGLDSESLSVKGQDLHSLQPYVGVTADYSFNGLGAKPALLQGRVGYAYETMDSSRSVSVTSGDGTGFSVPGATQSRGMLTAGLSLSMQVAKQFDVAVSYDTLFHTGNTSAQTFRLGATYRF